MTSAEAFCFSPCELWLFCSNPDLVCAASIPFSSVIKGIITDISSVSFSTVSSVPASFPAKTFLLFSRSSSSLIPSSENSLTSFSPSSVTPSVIPAVICPISSKYLSSISEISFNSRKASSFVSIAEILSSPFTSVTKPFQLLMSSKFSDVKLFSAIKSLTAASSVPVI